jgi:tetratricopeptide (TPR) repeat protein
MRRVAVLPILLVLAAAFVVSGCDTLSARMELKQGNQYYKGEKYLDALAHYQKGLEYDPSLRQVWRSVGLCAMTLFKPGLETPENIKLADTAIDAFKKYLDAYPEDQKVQDFLIGVYLNSNRFDDVLNYLGEQVKKNPGDMKSHKAIVNIYLRTKRIKEAFDWTSSHIPKDFESYHLVGIYCWDKSYRDSSLTVPQRSEYIELGLGAETKAVELNADYYEALVYTNLLLREKAKVVIDLKERDALNDKADEVRNRAIAVREKAKKQSASLG